MAKKKRARIEAVKSFSNVSHSSSQLKGRWREIFKNDNPISLELGCGRGEFMLALAEKYPHRNYIGVDLKGARLWAGAKQALDNKIANVFFIRENILELANVFEPGDVSEIWITFPDPYPKKPRKRMTAERYLDVYKKICAPDARLYLKTDDDAFFESSLESLNEYGCTIREIINDVHAQAKTQEELRILTPYEKRHIAAGRTIKYLQFLLPND